MVAWGLCKLHFRNWIRLWRLLEQLDRIILCLLNLLIEVYIYILYVFNFIFLVFHFYDRLEIETLNPNKQLVLHLREFENHWSRSLHSSQDSRSGWATLALRSISNSCSLSACELGHLPSSQQNQAQGQLTEGHGSRKRPCPCVFPSSPACPQKPFRTTKLSSPHCSAP